MDGIIDEDVIYLNKFNRYVECHSQGRHYHQSHVPFQTSCSAATLKPCELGRSKLGQDSISVQLGSGDRSEKEQGKGVPGALA